MAGSDDNGVEFLPLDIISTILVWLPVSCLLRCKSVCKSWLSLIESSDFVHRHALFTGNNPKMNLLGLTIAYPLEKPQDAWLFSVDDARQVPLDLPVIHDHYQAGPLEIVASWNGIICLRQHRTFCLWNPATKQCTYLPPLPIWTCEEMSKYGFGFDPSTNDYKVVSINTPYEDDSGDIESVAEDDTLYEDDSVDDGDIVDNEGNYLKLNDTVFHIYSLSSGYWREFKGFELPRMSLKSSMKTPYRDRFFCWMTLCYPKDKERLSEGIYTFDFSDEVFGGIPMPNDDLHDSIVFILSENIACAGVLPVEEINGFFRPDISISYEIWMLSDYEIKDSWTKLYTFDTGVCAVECTWTTWFPNDGGFLLFLMSDMRLCLYDIVNDQITILPVQLSDDRYGLVAFRESMLSTKVAKLGG